MSILFDFVTAFQNSSGEDANQYKEENKNYPKFCCMIIVSSSTTHLPMNLIGVHILNTGSTVLGFWRDVADILNCVQFTFSSTDECPCSFYNPVQQTSVEPV